jgi:hypothetical protein
MRKSAHNPDVSSILSFFFANSRWTAGSFHNAIMSGPQALIRAPGSFGSSKSIGPSMLCLLPSRRPMAPLHAVEFSANSFVPVSGVGPESSVPSNCNLPEGFSFNMRASSTWASGDSRIFKSRSSGERVISGCERESGGGEGVVFGGVWGGVVLGESPMRSRTRRIERTTLS